jgi:hypothetical protein
MKSILVSTAMLVLAAGSAAPAFAQASSTSGSAAPRKVPLSTLNVQSRELTLSQNRASNPPAKETAYGYKENDITAAKFGSKHWWAVQGWQAGGSGSQP